MSEDTTLERETKRRGCRTLQRHHWLCVPLLRAWRSTPIGRGDVIVPLHLQGQRVCMTPNGEMPRQLLRWLCHKLAVEVVRGPIRDRSGWLLPRLIRGGVGHDL